ncbi:MAG: AzlC family ABC transporter permease [Syntrophomonadaceae bacterium]|nr:AzlC family ABC transporter permease [Syntrophomonadaceae bacterium]
MLIKVCLGLNVKVEAWAGIKAGIPVVLAYLPLGLAFGVLATEAGLTISEATLMSALVFTGAGQYIAIGLLAAGGSAFTIIMANFLVNIRYLLFSTSLVPHLKKIPTGLASVLMLGLTDETYAVAAVHLRENEATVPYLAGLNLSSYLSWVASTCLGASIGHMIANTEQLGLNFALPAMYTILLVLVFSCRKHLSVAIIAVVVCLLIAFLFPTTLSNLSNIIVATLVAATAGVIIKR